MIICAVMSIFGAIVTKVYLEDVGDTEDSDESERKEQKPFIT